MIQVAKKKLNIILTGATGMVGGKVLEYLLNLPEVNQITAISRSVIGIQNEKLVEVIHNDFLNYNKIEHHFENQDICIYCLGAYMSKVPMKDFKRITVDFIHSFAKTLKNKSENIRFCLFSSMGADTSGKSKILFARYKGQGENIVKKMGFKNVHIFRPAYIFPVIPRKEPNFAYALMRFFYKPILSVFFERYTIRADRLAEVMVNVGIKDHEKIIFENVDILRYKT